MLGCREPGHDCNCVQRCDKNNILGPAKRLGAHACCAAGGRERHEKERFYRGQQSTTRGFMGMALQALSVLTRLAANPAIQARPSKCPKRSDVCYDEVRPGLVGLGYTDSDLLFCGVVMCNSNIRV